MQDILKNKVIKKLLSIIAIVFMLLQYIEPISSYAISGTGNWQGGQFDSYVKTTDDNGEYGVLIRRITNVDTNESYTVFCAENHVSFATGTVYNGEYYTPTNSVIKKACKVAYFGWYLKYGDYVVNGGLNDEGFEDVKLDYVFTQQYIWETLGQSNATFIDSNIQSRYESFKAEINNQINHVTTRPSFNKATITIDIGESYVATDTNGVLQYYSTIDATKNGIRFQHTKGENTLVITPTESCDIENYKLTDDIATAWGFMREGTEDNDTTIYFEFADEVQNQLYSMHYNDPVPVSLELQINLLGNLQIIKQDQNGNLIDGAKVLVEGVDNYSKEITITNGDIVLEKLKTGAYTIKETSAPNGYLLNTNTYTIQVKSNQTAKVEIIDKEPTGTFTLLKQNEDGTVNIKGTKYRIWNNSGYDKTFTTDSNGKIVVTGLELGTYYYQETNASYGYLLNPTIYSFELTYKDQNTEVIYGSATQTNKEPTGTFTLIKKNENSSSTITGAKYRIWNNSGYDKTLTTDSNGKIEIKGLKLGKYYYQEIQAPNGYLLDSTTYTFELVYKDQNTEVIYSNAERTNKEPTGNITIQKADIDTGTEERIDGTKHHGDASIAGTIYTLYANEDIYNVSKSIKYFSKDEEIATFTFDENGIATIKIINSNTTAKLKINNVTLEGLPMGAYYAKETKAPVGYTMDENKYIYTLSYKDQDTAVITTSGTVKNTVQKAKFEVIKISSNTNTTAQTIEGAEFTAILTKYVEYYGSFDEAIKHLDEYAEDEYSIFTTGRNGHGVSSLLAYGKYTVRETKTPSTQINTVAEFNVTIDKNSDGVIKEFVENDTPFDAYLKMIKEDKNTGKRVTLSNTTFTLYKLNEETTNWEQVSCKIGRESFNSWTTDSKGIAYTETKLKAGTYKIKEIQVPNGYLDMEEELIFKIENSDTVEYDTDWDAYITIVVENEQPTGTLELNKKVEIRENIDTSLIDDINLSQIEFKLTAKENIVDMADGSIIYEKGKEIGIYNLDENGNLTIQNLPLGTYEIEEIKTIDGLVLDTTKYEIKFTYENTTQKIYTETKEIINNTTLVEISKQDITGEKELTGAELIVVDENNEIIDSWTSTDVSHKIEGLQTGKIYTLRENLAPIGYTKASEIKFIVENTAEVQKVTMIDKIVEMTKQDIGGNEVEGAELQVIDENNNVVDEWISTKESHRINNLVEGKTYTLIEKYAPDGFVISNEVKFIVTTDKETQEIKMIDKIVEISKQDIAGNELEGAELKVYDKNGNIVDEWISGKEPHKVNGLIENEEYILHEEIVVDGYVKATDVKFTVTSDKETQKVVMIDKILEVVKTDLVTGEEIEGAELKVIDEDGNVIDEWTSTKEPHKVVGLEENKKYKLVETIAPYGYEVTEEIEFTVSENKETQRVEMKDMPILQDIKLVKIDSNTREVIKDKFSFGIYADEQCTKLIKEVESNKEDGTVLFENLRYGTYYIKEIAAPKGYVLSDKVIKVEMNDKGTFIDNEKVESEDSVYTFEFENVPVDTPKTGDNSNLKLYAGILGLSILALAYVGVHEYKKRKSVNKK